MKKTIFLLLSVVCLVSCSAGKLTVRVSNSLKMNRENEIVEVSKKSVFTKLKLTESNEIIVLDDKNRQVPYQFVSGLSSGADEQLIFQVNVKANGNSVYIIKKGVPEKFEKKVTGRLVPERKDDFNWENNRIAFRMYGQALQATGEISSGIDVWAKRSEKLVADKWYADELAGKKTYHTDGGEGLDFYKVGPTLGAGAAAPFVNEKIWLSKNFSGYEIVDNGSLRITFRLTYDHFEVDKIGAVKSTRVISLDAGSQLNKIIQFYDFDSEKMPIAAGIVCRNSPNEKEFTADNKCFAAYAEPADKSNGTLYVGIVSAIPFQNIEKKNNHLIGITEVSPQEPFTYYAGAGWSKFGFTAFEDWIKYLDEFSQKIQSPLKISIQ